MELHKIPGFTEALAAASREESVARALAFLDTPREICGIEVLQLTPRHYSMLSAAGSPLVCGGHISPGDVAVYLWAVSPKYSLDHDQRDQFILEISSLPFDALCEGIQQHLADAFVDAPPSDGTSSTPIASFASYLVDLFASEYGWRESDVLDVPFARLYQYWRRILRRYNPKAVIFNRLSDRVQRVFASQWLATQPAKPKRRRKAKQKGSR